MWHKYLTKAERPILSFDLFMEDFESLSGSEAQKFRHELIDSLMSKELNANDKKFLKRIGVEVRQGAIISYSFPWIPYPSKTEDLFEIARRCREIEERHFESYNRCLFNGLIQRQKNLIIFTSKKQEREVLAEFRDLIEEYKVFSMKTLAYKWFKYTNTSRKSPDKVYRKIKSLSTGY